MVWQRAVVCRGRGARDAKPAGRQEGTKWATPRPLGALICKCCGILEVSHLTGSQLLWTPVLTFVESPALFAESLCSRSLAQGLVFCCACETMSQAYSHPPKCLPCVAFAARGYRCKYVTVCVTFRVSRSVLGR